MCGKFIPARRHPELETSDYNGKQKLLNLEDSTRWQIPNQRHLNLFDVYRIWMFAEYIHAALSKATYEIIEDEEPFYGEVPELRGVWAIGKTLEECRENLKGVIEGWIALRLRLGLAIPPINGHTIEIPSRAEAVV